MIAVYDRLEQRVATSALDAFLQRLYLCIEVWLKEEGHAYTVVRSSVDDSVVGRFPFAICPSFHHVTNIHDECARDGIGVDPRTVLELDLKSAFCGIGEEKGDAAVI